jgi:hypothetical protein
MKHRFKPNFKCVQDIQPSNILVFRIANACFLAIEHKDIKSQNECGYIFKMVLYGEIAYKIHT